VGLIFGKTGWLEKRSVRRTRQRAIQTITKYRTMAMERYSGKDMAELRREGGWDVLALNWASPDGVWRSFTNAELEDAARFSSIVYACMRVICSAAPRAWMEIGEWDGSSFEADEKHPYLNMLRQPNPNSDWRTFLWNALSHWMLTGVSYVEKVRDPQNTKEIIGMFAWPTSWVTTVVNDKTGVPAAYEVGMGYAAKKRIVRLEDMFTMYQPDPSNPYGGIAPLHAALRDYQTDESRANLMIEVLKNTHFASVVLQQPDMWSEPQKEEIRSALYDLIGPGKRGEALFMSGEGSEVKFPEFPRDIDWPGMAGLSEARVCSCFGVPPVMIGMRVGLENSPWSNVGEAKRSFYADTMVPIWDWIASSLERGLFHSEGLSDEVEADYGHIPELQEDEDKLHERARSDWLAGGLTLDQYLEKIGEEAVGGDAGEARILPMNMVPFTPGEEIVPPPEPEQHVEEEEVEEEPITNEEGGDEVVEEEE